MTLTLDDVRNKRFRMARKSGYEVLEVDEFVDEVEESFAQLIEENQNLKKQVEALKAAPPPHPVAPAAPTVQAPPPPRQPAPPQPQSGTIVVTTGKEASCRGRAPRRDVDRTGRALGRGSHRGRQPDPGGGQPDRSPAHDRRSYACRTSRIGGPGQCGAAASRRAQSRREARSGDRESAWGDVRRPGAAARRPHSRRRFTSQLRDGLPHAISPATCASRSSRWKVAEQNRSTYPTWYASSSRPRDTQTGLGLHSRATMARLISGKTPRATAEVQVAILPASTLSWEISADLIPPFDQRPQGPPRRALWRSRSAPLEFQREISAGR